MSHYVKQKYQGVVFFSVLIFFQLITILGLYLLQASFLSKKMSMGYWERYHLFHSANARLRMIESANRVDDEFCYIGVMTRVDLLSKPLTWWYAYACTVKIDEISYYHVIEPLNSNACIKLDNVAVPIKYFRITLLVYSKNKVFREILQSVVVKLDNTKRDCSDDYSDISLGRQSLRRL